MTCTITAGEFKDYFDRGQFNYGTDLPAIRDKDINNAIAEAEAVFNCGLFPTEEACKQALYYLTAHFLQLDTEAAESEGKPAYTQAGRSADGLSESFHIPEWMKEGEFAFYATTYYGQKYLVLIQPYLGGAVVSVSGGTHP